MSATTYSELKVISDHVINTAFKKYGFYGYIFETLEKTGIRAKELTKCRWSKVADNVYTLQPQKANNVRIFKEEDLTEYYVKYINDYDITLFDVSYSSMLRYFNLSLYPYTVTYEKKMIGLHFFRHLYIKKLSFINMNFTDIKSKLGYKSDDMLKTYLYSNLSINN